MSATSAKTGPPSDPAADGSKDKANATKSRSNTSAAAPRSATPSPAVASPAANAGAKAPPLLLRIGGAAGCATLGLGLLALSLVASRRRGARSKASGKDGKAGPGPCSKLKPSSRCVPLADGSGCVVRREIPADNSCLFNSIGYAMHKSKTRAPHLRTVVAQQVSGDKTTYSDVFLGMANEAYCNWIRQPHTWGGGIELAILAQAYGIEIAAWNIESCKEHVFGEESGYKRQVMVIYNGVHYDALAVCSGPRANPEDDDTSYNPRTKRGKMIIAAARKLVELAHKESQFHNAAAKKAAAAAAKTAAANSTSSSAKANGTAATASTPSNADSGRNNNNNNNSSSNGTASNASTAPAPSASSSSASASTSASSASASGTSSSKPSAAGSRPGATRRVPRAKAAAAVADGAAAAAAKPAAAAAAAAEEHSAGAGGAAGSTLCCGDCGVLLSGAAAAQAHALSTGHQNYSEVAR